MKYTVDYFIDKFSKIPESEWCVYSLGSGGIHCALGHCGIDSSNSFEYEFSVNQEARAFSKLISILVVTAPGYGSTETNIAGYTYKVPFINDGRTQEYQQPTPKQRILAALHDIKKMQQPEQPEQKVIIKYVSVPETIKEMEVIEN